MNIVLLMGAGFAKVAGSPLADELFDQAPMGGSHERDGQVNLVQSQWYEWQKIHPNEGAEAFITHVYHNSAMFPGAGVIWRALQTYLALRISANFVHWSFGDDRACRSSDNFMNAHVGSAHEHWWNTFFHYHEYNQPLTVLTTNWDIWIERALRPVPRPRRRRPGFQYGQGPERLASAPRFPSRWYASTDFGKDTTIHGYVTLLKLHGSLSWAVRGGLLEKYGDLRPAFRGDAAIIPPIKQKEFANWLCPIWKQAEQALGQAHKLLIVGYSFPDYDHEIRQLLKRGITDKRIDVHIFDPVADLVAKRIGSFLPQISLIEHGAIPDASADLQDVIEEQGHS